MSDKPLSLQDLFLNGVRKLRTPSTVFLVKGVKLQGVVTWFDSSRCCCVATGVRS